MESAANEKQDRIIRAGMECFAKNGYRKTAVDEIVEKAGISKGLLFHYYGNKEKFYLHLYRFAHDLVYNHVMPKLDNGETDLFEKIRWTERVKIELLCEYPYVQDFLASVWNERDKRLVDKLREVKVGQPWEEDFLQGVDLSKLREDIEVGHVVKIIRWVGSGVLESHQKPLNLKQAMKELDAYLDTLKKGFYKEEFL